VSVRQFVAKKLFKKNSQCHHGAIKMFFSEPTPEKLNSGKSHDTPYSNAI